MPTRTAEATCPHCGLTEAPGAYCSGCVKKPGDPVKPKRERTRAQKVAAVHVVETIMDAPVAKKDEPQHNTGEYITGEYITGGPVEVIPPTVPTREAWLLEATTAMRPWFAERDAEVPALRVSIGWPAGRSAKKNTIGQCFQSPLVADGQPAIFVSPVLADPVVILATLAHEMVHAVVPPMSVPHRGPFVKLAKAIGLIGPWTATTPGEELKAKLVALAEQLGPFEHAAVSKGGNRIVQGTRMLKVQCPDCGCVVRMTRKWLDEAGTPKCGCGTGMVEAQ